MLQEALIKAPMMPQETPIPRTATRLMGVVVPVRMGAEYACVKRYLMRAHLIKL